MAISIHDILHLPVMKKTNLVAGHSGLSKMVKWVTIVEVLEDTTRLQQGEFLITTGFGLDKDVEAQEQFRKLLRSNILSGVALYTGFYINEIPDSFIDAANDSGLPLIEIPDDINFSMITKAILEQIVNNQMQLLEYSVNIHKELTKLVLDNQNLNDITKTLANLTSSTIILYDNLYNPVNKNRNNQISIDKGSNRILSKDQLILFQQMLKKCIEEMEMHHIKLQNYSLTFCPIIAKKYCYGCIVSIKPVDQWSETDTVAIEHAATIYAIEYLKQEAVEKTQISLQGDFLDDIINNQYAMNDAIFEKARKLGYNLSAKQSIFYITLNIHNLKSNEINNLNNRFLQIINQLLSQKNRPYLIRSRFDSLMLLTEVVGATKKEIYDYCNYLASEIERQWLYYFPKVPIIIGIGRSYEKINELSKSVSEAKNAVLFSDLLIKNNSIIHFDNLGMYQLLIKMMESGIDLELLYLDSLKALIEHRQKGTDLIETLEVFLNNNQNIQTTSSELFIHRHTLKYRLKQIEEKTGFDLKSADHRMKLQLGIMAFKFVNLIKEKEKRGKH